MMETDRFIEFAYLLNQQTDLKETLRLISHKACALLRAEIGVLLLLNPRTRETIKTVFKEGVAHENPCFRALGRQVSGWMMKFQPRFLSTDIAKDERFEGANSETMPAGSVIGTQFRMADITLGSLILINKYGASEFGETDLSLLEQLAIIASPYLYNAQGIQAYFETPIPQSTLLAKYENAGLIGKSRKFIELLKSVEAAAGCDVRIMLEGQSGTGKELIARAIHRFSHRNQNKFIAIDCGAIPEHLLESELFGFEKGAFTGANQARTGLIAEADGGTLFIDEIANLPVEMQSKFMRVLQENEIRPLGSNRSRKIDVRIISASSRPLRQMVNQQQFREDLFYRLFVYPVHVPSLNERKADIPLLAHHFLQKFSKAQNKNVKRYNEKIIEFLKSLSWPGNIRELENFVERLVTYAGAERTSIDADLIPIDIKPDFDRFLSKQNIALEAHSLQEKLSDYEHRVFLDTLEDTGWNQTQAARILKISEQNFRYRMKKLKIRRPRE
ncbi:MAG: sigma 54-interacting transcriptional regulator [bacterium]